MDDLSSFTINKFCARNSISRGKYYDLRRKKKGPREMDVDGMTRITREAELDWQRSLEANHELTEA